MKEKGKMWVAKATVLVFLAVMLVQLIAGSESAWSAVRAGLYFGVLLGGYHWGIAGGAVGGILGGMAELIRHQGIEGVAILCVMGVLAGCFRRLGRGGSVLASLCGAAGLGMLYAERYFWLALPELLVAGVLFLLMPVGRVGTVPDGEPIHGGLDEMQRQKLEEAAESYGKLARTMVPIPREDCREECCLDKGTYEGGWKGRFMESREAVSLQFREMERTLKEMAVQLDQAVDVTSHYEKQIRGGLGQRRLQLRQLLVLKRDDDRREAYVTVSAGGAGCVTAKEVGEMVGRTLARSLRPADGGRTIVGKEPCTIHLVEETRYRLLSGLAKECKDEEELSGDNFSCHDLPDGQVMLCLSDGMGSGRQAFLESQLVTETMEELLDAGFAPERAIHMINALLLVQDEQTPTTLDLALVDLYTGQARFYKQGAVGTFIRRGSRVLQVEPGALPMGVDCGVGPAAEEVLLEDGDMIVMVTDGILDALEGEDKEAVLCEYLAGTTKNNARELAEELLQMACGGRNGVRDDMTVLTAGFWKR